METLLTPRTAVTPRSHAPLRVLVVDECSHERRAVCDELRRQFGAGLRLWEAEEAADALDVLRRHDVDLAFVEYPRPGWDGRDLVREIAAADEEAIVILLTGHGGPIVPAEALRRGADAYLSKSELSGQPLPSVISRLRAERRKRPAAKPLNLRELAEHLHHVECCLHDSQRMAQQLSQAVGESAEVVGR